MKKANSCLIVFKYVGLFLIFVIGIITIIGSANNPQQAAHDSRMRTFEMLEQENYEINTEMYVWEHSKEVLLDEQTEYNAACQAHKQEENQFVQKMSDEQLKAYSSYIKAVNSNNIAEQEIYSRKFIKSLNKKQLEKLLQIYKQSEHLEQQEASLEENEKKMQKQIEWLVYWRNDWLRRSNQAIAASNQAIASYQSNTNPIIESLESWQQSLHQQQQQRTMNSIDNSLQSISRSLGSW